MRGALRVGTQEGRESWRRGRGKNTAGIAQLMESFWKTLRKGVLRTGGGAARKKEKTHPCNKVGSHPSE